MKKVRKSLALDAVDCPVMPKSRRKSLRTEIRNGNMVSVNILLPTQPTHRKRYYYSCFSFVFSVLCTSPNRKSLCWFRSAPRQFAGSSMKASWIRDSCWVPVTVQFFPACNNHFLQVSPLLVLFYFT